MIWGVVAMPRSSPDYYAAMMGNFILGRLGLMGRLGDNVRDKQGLAYYVTSSLHTGMGPQPWSIVAGVSPEFVDRAICVHPVRSGAPGQRACQRRGNGRLPLLSGGCIAAQVGDERGHRQPADQHRGI